MSKSLKPLYGIISYTGGRYAITCQKESRADGSNISGSIEGYGSFPFNEYPNMPVIDYTNNEAVYTVLSWNVYIEESTIKTQFDEAYNPDRFIPLKEFLRRVADVGIVIHNYNPS